jgi:protein tyrosine/serine phosphatase
MIRLVLAIMTIWGAFAAGSAAARDGQVESPLPARPATWAEPVVLEGVPNLHRISPTLYRSQQPTALGFRNLEKLGVRTVINLRAFNDDLDELRGTTLRAVHVPVHTWHLETEDIVQVMRELSHPENGPFLIHCQHGADRTGLMSAIYRMLEQDWSADAALAELVDGGYGYHSMWRNIKRYVLSVDVAGLRSAIESSGSTKTVTDN